MHADDEQALPDADRAVREREDEHRRPGGTPGAPGGGPIGGNEKPGDDPDVTYDVATDPAHIGSDDLPTPASGGYAGRDPQSEMPSMPSVPETQDDAREHDAAPSKDKPIEPYG